MKPTMTEISYGALRQLRDSLRPVDLRANNLLLRNQTLNPRRVGQALHELARPRLFEQVMRYPAFVHNALIEVLHERLDKQ